MSALVPAKKKIRLKVASPCKESWDGMVGDDAVRFCRRCEKNVYQLSNMTAAAIEALLADKGGDLCVRFFQRKDGTVLTADCPVGARRRRRKQVALGVGAGALSLVGVGLWPADSVHSQRMQPVEALMGAAVAPEPLFEPTAPAEPPADTAPPEEPDVEEVLGAEPVQEMQGALLDVE